MRFLQGARDSQTGRLGPEHQVSESSVEAKVIEIVAEQLGIAEDEVSPESTFGDDLGADALDQIELVMALEEEFEIDIDEGDAAKLKTVGDVVEYVSGLSQ